MVAAAPPVAADGGKLPWCEREDVLASLYGFAHRDCSALQDEQSIKRFIGVLVRFLKSLLNEEPWLSERVTLARAIVLAASPVTAAHGGMRWFPEYGAALLVLQPHSTQAVPGQAWISMLGLDDWRFRLHSKADGSAQHTASCEGSRLLPCGCLPVEQLEAYVARLDSLLAKAQKRHDEERSSHGSKRQGHQKTPALIHALALQALQPEPADGQEEKERPPRGGFTDVGLHTGGTPRDTAWPLVREAFKACIEHCMGHNAAAERPADLFAAVLAQLHLWLSQRQVELISPAVATSTALNAAMRMLGAAKHAGAEVAEGGRQLDGFEEACLAARRKLEAAAAAWALQSAEPATLPPLVGGESCPCGPGSYRSPRGMVPPQQSPSQEAEGFEAARRRQAANLGFLPVPTATAERNPAGWVDAALELCSEQAGASDMAAQHVLSLVERELFSRAADASRLQAAGALGEAGVETLYNVVQSYREVLQGFLASDASSARMRVELRSRELLVTWVAYCMADTATCRSRPLVAKYGVSLLADNLRHMVLSDRQACDALLGVAAYLRQRRRIGRPLFSLADGGGATLSFAAQFAGVNGVMASTLRQEQAAAAGRQEEHWRQVQEKQREASQLQQRLQHEKQELAAAEAVYKRAVEDRNGNRSRDWFGELQAAVNRCAVRVNDARSTAETTEKQLKAALAAPTPVIQPLPQDAIKARQTIFFAHCPPLLRRLASLSFLAQQLLVPTEGLEADVLDEAMLCIAAAAPTTWLVDHYNSQQASPYLANPGRRGADGLVLLVSDEQPMTEDELLRRLPTVDRYHSDSFGVWHPDQLLPRMAWQGCGVADAVTGWFNPWARMPAHSVVDGFTEQLPAGAAELQWAMLQYGSGSATAADRGNEAIARQDQQPRWLSKPGFLAFGMLRAYPLQQLRQLCVALRQRSLPLGHPAVRTLVRQALYHVGPLTGGEKPTLLWRTEWGSGGSQHGDLLQTLHAELHALADELRESPREADAVLLLGEVAAFLAGWHPPLQAVARSLAATAARWADDLEREAAAAPPQECTQLRAKQAQLRMTALCCFGGGGMPLASDDAACMLRLAVLVHHGSVYCHSLDQEGTEELRAQSEQLEVLCHWAMARRADEIVAAAKSHPAMLTAALRAVIQRAPEDLQWERLGWQPEGGLFQPSASWQAEGSDGHLYSINCLDGTVLEDGTPPGRLPSEILHHALYSRTFSVPLNKGESSPWGFEVTKTASGVRRSLAPVRSWFYEFHLAADGGLVAVEIDDRGNRLELLDVGVEGCPCPGWGAELPPRLRQLHSHWLCRERGIIVLRPIHFRERSTHFLLLLPAPGGSTVQWATPACACRSTCSSAAGRRCWHRSAGRR